MPDLPFPAAHWLNDEKWRGHSWNDLRDMLPDYLSKVYFSVIPGFSRVLGNLALPSCFKSFLAVAFWTKPLKRLHCACCGSHWGEAQC